MQFLENPVNLCSRKLQVPDANVNPKVKQIPGLSSSLKSTHILSCRKPSRNKPDWELRRLAFNFPKQTSTGPDTEQKKKYKAKPRKGKVIIHHWGTEEVDAQVKKLLMRKYSLKPLRKRENKKKVITQAKKTLGKFGRGDAPHEYWEEERRIREKKAREKLAKREKPKPELKAVPILTDEPWGETEKGKVEILRKLFSLPSRSEYEQEEDMKTIQGSDYIKDVGSHEVLHYPNTQVTSSVTLAHSEEREVKVQRDALPFASRGESDLGEERQLDLGSIYIKDDRSHKVFNNSRSKVHTWKENPSLTSSSESEEEEDTQIDSESFHIKDMKSNKGGKNGLKDLQSKYIEAWSSHKVSNKSRIQPILSDSEYDFESQFGDDESEYKENGNYESRKKTLKRGRGGAAPGEWQEMAEEERMKMVAIKRNKMVRIAQQVKM